MKLQLNEETLNAYISEAINQELNEGLMNNRVRVDFSKLGNNGVPEEPERKNKFLWANKNKSIKNRLGTDSNSWWKGYHYPAYLSWSNVQGLVTSMRNLGYSDDQILLGIKNGAFQFGEVKDGEFMLHSKKNQNKMYGHMLAVLGKTVYDLQNIGTEQPADGNTGTGTDTTDGAEKPGRGLVRDPQGDTDSTSGYPWDSITQEQINAAKQKQAQMMPKRRGLVKPNQGQTGTTQPEQPQTRDKITGVNPVSNNQVNTPGVTGPAHTIAQKPAAQPNFATNAINAIGQQIQSGHPELATRTAQTAINAIQKNGTGSPQDQAAIQQIQTALANLTKNNQQ